MDRRIPDVYAARAKDQHVLESSSSGGLFTLLSDAMFERNGAVMASVYSYNDQTLSFRLILSKEERGDAKGSKYLQSNVKDAFQTAHCWLKSNPDRPLLFVGLGCQADAFRRYAESNGFRDRVWIVDIICHGTPSPQIWREYIRPFAPDYVTFKDKRNGWLRPTALAIKDGEEIPLDQYVRMFYKHANLRPSCYTCPYASLDRYSDITIGDYWGIQNKIPDFYHTMGNSLVLIHTETGKDIWNGVQAMLDFCVSNTVDCLQNNLIRPTACPENRRIFWKEWHEKGTEFVMMKYGQKQNDSFATKLKKRIKKQLKKFGGGVFS